MSDCFSDQKRELAPGVYWVGDCQQSGNLHCNPYLIIDGGEGVLIDPGSPLDFAAVLANVTRLIPLDRIKHIILQHQDPDFCSSTPLFEQQGFAGSLATHWRAAALIKYYGVRSPFYIVNNHQLQLTFGQGRVLRFLPTPYLHFPGAITTYDPMTKTLFSSDLFGSFSQKWTLFADEYDEDKTRSYMEAMLAFHEHYMPSNDILRPVMETFLQMDISRIAPQHGSVIRHNLTSYITALRDLECGNLLHPIIKDLSRTGGYTGLLNQILKRYYSLYSHEEVFAIFAATSLQLAPETGLISDYNITGTELWQRFFEYIYSQKGLDWLIAAEPLVSRLAKEYELEMPAIFQSALLSQEKIREQLHQENQQLKAVNLQLAENLQQAEDSLIKCPLTHLYNELFFTRYLEAECRSYQLGYAPGSMVAVSIDGMNRINMEYGPSAGDEILRIAAVSIEGTLESNYSLFRLSGPVFAVYLSETNKSTAAAYGEDLRYLFQQSVRFVTPITVSAAVVSFSGFSPADAQDPKNLTAAIMKTLNNRLQEARRQGGNKLCIDGELGKAVAGKVLLVDSDTAHSQVLQQALEDANISVLTAIDGHAALEIINREQPELIISELLLPKIDGFLLRERLRQDSANDRIPFFLVSFLKDPESMQRALTLEIEHYFRKPYPLAELVGLVLLKLRQNNR